MKTALFKNHRLVFYASWILLTLIQAGLTELLDDEAYYWVYSKYPDWGYFDHPPMTAILIKCGYSIFQNELGVRLFLVIFNVLSLVIIEKLIDRKSPITFYAIALSLAVLQLSGFVAVPDIPLIFFTALFFLIYKRFLAKASLLNTFLLGVVMAALCYSKYHAALIIFFVLLSNLKILLRYQIYFAGLVALLVFAPHLWWQYQHDWISFRYHLFESNVNAYKPSFTLDYIGGQILLAGPVAGIILLPAAFLYHTKNVFEKGLKFTLAGIYIFFLLSSFRGKVEGNWTSPVLIPLIVLSHNFLIERPNWHKWLLRLLPVTLIIVLFARVIMIVDIIPSKEIRKKFHGWKEWPQQMKEVTEGKPIVWGNSYQRASKYWFYTGQMSYSLNWYRERRNNFNFWPVEDSLLGKSVYILDIHNLDSFTTRMKTPLGDVGFRPMNEYASFAKVLWAPDRKEIHAKENQPFKIRFTTHMSEFYFDYIKKHYRLQTDIVLGVFGKKGWIKDLPVPVYSNNMFGGTLELEFNPEVPKGKYHLILSVFSKGTITPTHNSEKVKLVIE